MSHYHWAWHKRCLILSRWWCQLSTRQTGSPLPLGMDYPTKSLRGSSSFSTSLVRENGIGFFFPLSSFLFMPIGSCSLQSFLEPTQKYRDKSKPKKLTTTSSLKLRVPYTFFYLPEGFYDCPIIFRIYGPDDFTYFKHSFKMHTLEYVCVCVNFLWHLWIKALVYKCSIILLKRNLFFYYSLWVTKPSIWIQFYLLLAV